MAPGAARPRNCIAYFEERLPQIGVASRVSLNMELKSVNIEVDIEVVRGGPPPQLRG